MPQTLKRWKQQLTQRSQLSSAKNSVKNSSTGYQSLVASDDRTPIIGNRKMSTQNHQS